MATAPYCPYLPSRTFASAVNISGHAVYEYRINGNGQIANGQLVLLPTGSGAQTYTITINSVDYSFAATASSMTGDIFTGLISAITADANAVATLSTTGGDLYLSPKNESTILNVSVSSNISILRGAAPNPIRFAEVSIRDSSNNIVQCAETDASGNFSFQLPQGSSTYTVAVSPRANNSQLQAYVLQDPDGNETYFVSTQVSAAQATNNVSLVAPANGTLEGGAFNILDQLARANIFMRGFTSVSQGCGTTYPDCNPFKVGPMVYVYWKKGFNPGVYEGLSPTSGISYYLPGRSELYIMGGVNGDVDYSDTDHFDNSVIIHEYGHFMEDHYGKSDSPGGSHDGYSQLDPRLAWSEGWADFFQAAVTGNPVYRDTYGTPDGSAGIFFNEDLEHLTASSADVPNPNPFGEGNYHEFSITRLLWDAVDPFPGSSVPSTDESVNGPFAEIWAIFSGPTSGFHSTSQHFRSIGLFHLLQNSKPTHTDWSSLRTMEYQDGDRRNYGAVLSACATASTESMTPVSTYETDYFRNNRFFSYYHPGGTLDIALNYSTPSGALADLDLMVYPESYVFGTDSSAASQSTPPTNCSSSTNCSEHVRANLDAGFYLINITAAPADAGATQFNLTINSQPMCVTN